MKNENLVATLDLLIYKAGFDVSDIIEALKIVSLKNVDEILTQPKSAQRDLKCLFHIGKRDLLNEMGDKIFKLEKDYKQAMKEIEGKEPCPKCGAMVENTIVDDIVVYNCLCFAEANG